MKKTVLIAFSFFIFLACNESTPDNQTGQINETTSPMNESNIQRIVCFKFKPGTSQEAIDQHMKGFAGLKDSISYILTYHAGPTVLADLTGEPEYDVMHYCTYRNEEEIKLYAVHPVHQRFIEKNSVIWEKVLVINSKTRP